MAPRFVAYRCTPPHFDVLLFNLRRGLQAGPRLRSALAAAVPRRTLADEVFPDDGTAGVPVDLTTPFEIDLFQISTQAPTSAGPEPSDADGLATANAMLDALEWPRSGRAQLRRRATGPLRITLMWDGTKGRAAAAVTRIREAWRAAGVHVAQATASWTYLLNPLTKGDFDVAFLRIAGPSDADLWSFFHSRGDQNLAGVGDDALDRALDQYRHTRDRAGRQQAKAAVARALQALQVVVMVHNPEVVMLFSHDVGGIEFVDDLPRLDRLTLSPPQDGLRWRQP